jgi:tartrate dehydratase alpha subunit/fumarate hydratase class I-like protein
VTMPGALSTTWADTQIVHGTDMNSVAATVNALETLTEPLAPGQGIPLTMLLATAYNTLATPSTLVEWDANKNVNANNVQTALSTGFTASGTTQPLTVASAGLIIINSGSTNTTLTMPTTGVPAGMDFEFVNLTSATITINASGGGTLVTLAPYTSGFASSCEITAIVAAPTTAAQWNVQHLAIDVTNGKILHISNTITLGTTGSVDGNTYTFPGATDTIVGLVAAQAISNKTLTLTAGSTTVAPLKLTSGTNLTTPAAGAMEYDGVVPYFSPAASTRAVLVNEQFCTLTTAYSGTTSTTAAQKLFNASTNGAVTVPVGTYFFECFFSLSSMSASSGTFGFALGGTATIAAQLWESEASMTALATAVTPYVTVNTAANVALTAVNTTGLGWAKITGKIRVSVTGTVIPQFSLGVAATPVVGVDSYFRIWQDGVNTVQTVGNWS